MGLISAWKICRLPLTKDKNCFRTDKSVKKVKKKNGKCCIHSKILRCKQREKSLAISLKLATRGDPKHFCDTITEGRIVLEDGGNGLLFSTSSPQL